MLQEYLELSREFLVASADFIFPNKYIKLHIFLQGKKLTGLKLTGAEQ